jgi:hypothetical protein
MFPTTDPNKIKNNLALLLDIDTIKDSAIRDKLYKKLKRSLLPEWTIPYDKELYFYNCPSWKFITQNTMQSWICKHINDSEYKNHILNSFNTSNQLNDSGKEDLTSDTVNKIYSLYKCGLMFQFKDSPTQIIPITKNDILFPICDVGKNRSQYLFYFLKHLQSHYPDTFIVGYPSSADEMASIFDIGTHNQSILSSFVVGYKSDNFSESLYKHVYNKETGKLYSDTINNPFPEISRSIHVFDSLLKEREEYTNYDLKNYEKNKYRIHKYDIFDKDNKDLSNIKDLYKKYFLTPNNLRKIINLGTETPGIKRITYICMSTQSFITMCNILHLMKKYDNLFDLSNIRIVYFAIKDIFQRSSFNQKILNDFMTKINSSFRYVDN